jgi:deoxyribose-phosphate aldolase
MGVNQDVGEKGAGLTREEFLRNNDHSLLKPNLTTAVLTEGLEYAAEVGCGAVCISAHRIRLAADVLAGTGVEIATVVGFPTGTHATSVKAVEARQVIDDGATALDMVMDIGAMIGGETDRVRDDMVGVVEASGAVPVKVILEVDYLTDDQVARACDLATDAGVAYVKTSTGFVPGGATPHIIALMRRSAGAGVRIKASGGLATRADVEAVHAAGADRWGISRTREILAEF